MNAKEFILNHRKFYYIGHKLLYFSIILSIMVFIFNILFEPFNIEKEEHKMNFLILTSIKSIIVFLSTYISIRFAGKFFIKQKWNIVSEFFLIMCLSFLIGVILFLTRDIFYENPDNWSIRYLVEEIRNALFTGVLIMIIYLPYLILIYKNEADGGNQEQLITIKSRVKSDTFSINPDKILYAKSDGNYLELFYDDGGSIRRAIIRLTIKELEKQLKDYNFLIKVHRSFIINNNKILKIKKKPQGVALILNNIKEEIPVARTVAPLFRKSFDYSNNHNNL